MTEAEFVAIVRRNPVNRALLERLPGLGLGDAWLTAGCLFQSVWNDRTGRPPEENISDYDIFYYDATDLSWEAEDRVIHCVAAACADLGATIEVKNQARVHLWYRGRFGEDYPALTSCEDGIGRFLVRGTCVAIHAGSLRVYAPFGLDDVASGTLRPNPPRPVPARFHAKAASYHQRWPHLVVLGD